jgi:hypothetical protein
MLAPRFSGRFPCPLGIAGVSGPFRQDVANDVVSKSLRFHECWLIPLPQGASGM